MIILAITAAVTLGLSFWTYKAYRAELTDLKATYEIIEKQKKSAEAL